MFRSDHFVLDRFVENIPLNRNDFLNQVNRLRTVKKMVEINTLQFSQKGQLLLDFPKEGLTFHIYENHFTEIKEKIRSNLRNTGLSESKLDFYEKVFCNTEKEIKGIPKNP